jgi:hypothetical protein
MFFKYLRKYGGNFEGNLTAVEELALLRADHGERGASSSLTLGRIREDPAMGFSLRRWVIGAQRVPEQCKETKHPTPFPI